MPTWAHRKKPAKGKGRECFFFTRHAHTHKISVPAYNARPASAELSTPFFSWLRNRAGPLMPIPPSNPLSDNNGTGQAGGRSPCLFYQSNNRTTRPVAAGPWLPLISLCFARVTSMSPCLSDKRWTLMVSCCAACTYLPPRVTAWVEGRSEIRA